MVIFEKLKNFKFWNQKKEIMALYCHPDLEEIIPKPEPAIKHLPKWFKDLQPTYDEFDNFGSPGMTAKRCLPLIDSMSLGYVIRLAGDVRIKTNRNCTQINHIQQSLKLVDYHHSNQVGGNHVLKKNQGDVIKFINYWIIKTAPGWSTLIEPMPNVFDSPFTCLTGLVDTDVYPQLINFPAIWNVPDADILLKAGTPLVRVIPIQRSAIAKVKNDSVVRKMTDNEFKTIAKIQKKQELTSNYYTFELRVKK